MSVDNRRMRGPGVPSSWRRLLAVGSALALCTATLVLAASPGGADPPNGPKFGPPSHLVADNNFHSFHHRDLTYDVWNAVEWSRVNSLDEPTSMATDYDDTLDQYVDVVSYDEDYTNYLGVCWDPPQGQATCDDGTPGYAGLTVCMSGAETGNPDTMCQQFEVRYDLSDTDTYTERQRRSLACHEIGHTVGFDDYEQGEPVNPASCMMYAVEADAFADEYYMVHELEHINNQYPVNPPSTSSTTSGGPPPTNPDGSCQIGGGVVMGAPGEELASSGLAICPQPGIPKPV